MRKLLIPAMLAGILPLCILAQQPGGVGSPKIWYVTATGANRSFWKDISGNNFPNIGVGVPTLNVNFHPAAQFQTGNPHPDYLDFKPEELTIIGIFYPFFRDGQTLYYKVGYNNSPVFESFDKKIRDSSGWELAFTPNFSTVESDKGTAMRVFAYSRARMPDLPTIWGREQATNFELDFRGTCPEFLIYDRDLSAVEVAKLSTYLAIKYGITLDTSYTGGDGSILWDKGKNARFHHRVCAIGKDSLAALFQPKANSTYEDSYWSYNFNANGLLEDDGYIDFIPKTDSTSVFRSLTIGFEDKSMTGNPDKAFLFWGDDDGDYNDKYGIDPVNFPGLTAIRRNFYMQNDQQITSPTRLEVASKLHESMYNPFDYKKYRYVLIKLKPNLKDIDTTILFHYFGRREFWEDSPVASNPESEDDSAATTRQHKQNFYDHKTVWDSIGWSSGQTFFTFGFAPRLQFTNINSTRIPLRSYKKGEPIYATEPPWEDTLTFKPAASGNFTLTINFKGGIPPFDYSVQQLGRPPSPVKRLPEVAPIVLPGVVDKGIYVIVVTDKINQVISIPIKTQR